MPGGRRKTSIRLNPVEWKAGTQDKEINIMKKLLKKLQKSEAFDKVVYGHRVSSTYTRNRPRAYFLGETFDGGKGINITGQNITNITYAD